MKRMAHRPVWIRALAVVSGVTLVTSTIPVATASPSVAMTSPSEDPNKKEQAIRPNQTPPSSRPLPPKPAFSASPSDLELRQARVFEEPLVPIGRATTAAENSALARAIDTYVQRGGGEDVSPLERFLADYPETPWRGSLLTDLGIVYRRTGYFSKALAAWEGAWTASNVATDRISNAIADRALAELAELNSRLGRADRLVSLFSEIGSRDIHGSAAERVSQAGKDWR